MTTRERTLLRRVFADALAYQESLLASYYVEIDPADVRRMRVPRTLRADARRVQAEITRYRRLQARLLNGAP